MLTTHMNCMMPPWRICWTAFWMDTTHIHFLCTVRMEWTGVAWYVLTNAHLFAIDIAQVFFTFHFPIHSFRFDSFRSCYESEHMSMGAACVWSSNGKGKLSHRLCLMRYQSLFSILYSIQSQMYSCVFSLHLTLMFPSFFLRIHFQFYEN